MKRIRKIEDLTFNQLKELASKLHLKDYTKHNSHKKLLEFIKETVPHHELNAFLNPSWWKRNANTVYGWASIIGLAITIGTIFWSLNVENDVVEENNKAITVDTFIPIFLANDTSHFNILILRFEDYIAHENTECIGRSIQEHLNNIQVNDPPILPLNIHYADTIPPPENPRQVRAIQEKHNADLVIYGLANNVQENCAGADVCFRYSISEQVVAQIAPVIEVKTIQHELDYKATSPSELQKGKFQIDALSLEFWIKGLGNVKMKNEEDAYLDLDMIGGDVSLDKKERAERYYNIGGTYYSLMQFSKAVKAYNKSIELNPENADVYYDRGLAYFDLQQYSLMIEDLNSVIKLNPGYVDAYYERAFTYSKMKEYRKAIKDFDKCIEFDPEYAYSYNNRGNLYRRIGNLEKAKKDINKSLSLDDQNGWAYATLAMIYADDNNMEFFYKNLEIAITKPLAYPLIKQLEEEETLQQFKDEQRFKILLDRSKVQDY